MMDFFVPELVNAVMAERSKEADSLRVAAEVERVNPKPRLRPRVALALGDLGRPHSPRSGPPRRWSTRAALARVGRPRSDAVRVRGVTARRR